MKYRNLSFLLITCFATIFFVDCIDDSVMAPFIAEVNKADVEEEQSLVPFSDSVEPFSIVREPAPETQLPHGNTNSNRILEDLIDMQKKYEMLKDQWNKIQDQKREIIMNTSTTTTATTIPPEPTPAPSLSVLPASSVSNSIKQYAATTKSFGSNEIEEVDVDVFEDRGKFTDISTSDDSNSLNFDDISVTKVPQMNKVSNELAEIESAIMRVLGKDGTTIKPEPVPPTAMISVILGKQNAAGVRVRPQEKNEEAAPTLFEIIGPKTTRNAAKAILKTEIMTTTQPTSTENPIAITIEPIVFESTTSANDYDEVKAEDKSIQKQEPEESEVVEDGDNEDQMNSLEDDSMEQGEGSLLDSFGNDNSPMSDESMRPVRVEPTPRHFEVRPIGFEHQVPSSVATAWRRKLENMPAEEGISDPFDPESKMRNNQMIDQHPRSKVFRKITRRIITKSRNRPEDVTTPETTTVATSSAPTTTTDQFTTTTTATTTTATAASTTPISTSTTTTVPPLETTTSLLPSTTTNTPLPSTTTLLETSTTVPTPAIVSQQDPTSKPAPIFTPSHALQKSSFFSSGKNSDSLPATNRFKFPNHVLIPFYGAKPQEWPTTIMTTTTTTTMQTPQSFEIKKEKEEVMTVVNEDADSQSTETSESGIIAPIEGSDNLLQGFQTFGGSFGSKKGPSELPEFSFSIPEPVESVKVGSESTATEKPIAVEFTPPLSPSPSPSPIDELGAVGVGFQFGRDPPQTFGSKRGPSEFPFEEETIPKGVGTFGTKLASSDGTFGKEDFTFGNKKDELIPFKDRKNHMPVHKNADLLKEEIAKLPTVYHPPPVLNTNNENKNTIGILMQKPKNPYIQRTTMSTTDTQFETPIGPHGLQEQTTTDINLDATKAKISSVEMLLPAWGIPDNKKKTKKSVNNGILTEARKQYQNEFEQQVRDFKMINEEIGKISRETHVQAEKQAEKCEPIYAQPLSVPQLQQMSQSLGLLDLSKVIQQAADTSLIIDDDLETRLDDKRRLVSKIELLLSLAESRHVIHELLVKQKKLEQELENAALEMIDNANFHPNNPSSISDMDELSSAVQSVLGNEIENNFMNMNMENQNMKKKSNLQETAEIVEPVLSKLKSQSRKNMKLEKTTTKLNFIPQAQNDRSEKKTANINGRAIQGFKINRRPTHPVAPPTMSPEEMQFFNPAQMAAPSQKNVAPIRPPFRPPTDDELTDKNESPSSINHLIDMLHQDISNIPADQEACEQVKCDFENADLCNFESSHDETTRRRRNRRSSEDLLDDPPIADDLLPYTFRAWSIWAGRRAENQKQIDIGPEFSRHNTHFAAIFLEPEQAGILSAPLVLTGKKTKIRMKIFEGTRGIKLRVCCDRYCPLETEEGIYRGHRFWLRKTIICPANTQMISFECLNEGKERGACGVDDIFVESSNCRQLFTGVDQN